MPDSLASTASSTSASAVTRADLDRLLALPAGRELDAAVAEYVMGFKRRDFRDAQLSVDGSCGCPRGPHWCCAGGPWLDCYSTDLAAAYEALQQRGVAWKTYQSRSGKAPAQALVYVLRNEHGVTNSDSLEGTASTLPLAMCRAALAAAWEEREGK